MNVGRVFWVVAASPNGRQNVYYTNSIASHILNFYTVLPMESLCFQEERRGTSEDLAVLDLLRHFAVGGLEIGRIYMGNYAGLALEILKGLLRRYDPVHGVIYVVVLTH